MSFLVRKSYIGDCSWTAPAGVTTVTAYSCWTQNYVSAGNSAALIIDVNCDAYAWGNNNRAQLGNGTITPACQPTLVSCSFKWRQISLSDGHAIGILFNGDAYAWGCGLGYKIGNANCTNHCLPTIVSCAFKWKWVTAGTFSSGGITTDGIGYAWGCNSAGRLGTGNATNQCVPTAISGGLKWRSLIFGDFHSSGIDSNGDGYSWGCGTNGRLGTGNTTSVCVPTLIVCGFKWKHLVAGENGFGLGITCDGDMYAWGNNTCGQLGNGSRTNSCSPLLVCCGLKWKCVTISTTCNSAFVLAIACNGDAYAWGDNTSGKLGTGTGAVCLPTPVLGSLKYKSIAINGCESLGVTTEGCIYVWGLMACGISGDNNTTSATSPQRVPCCALNVGVNIPQCRKIYTVTPGCSYCLKIMTRFPQFNFDILSEQSADQIILEYWA